MSIKHRIQKSNLHVVKRPTLKHTEDDDLGQSSFQEKQGTSTNFNELQNFAERVQVNRYVRLAAMITEASRMIKATNQAEI